MPGAKTRFAAPALLVALAAALPLAGCQTMSDPLGTIAASPGQYDYYDCPAIERAAIDILKRQRELRGLIARANQGPAGGFISATTYEPEYVTLRGKMNELRRAAVEKKCNFDPATALAAPSPSPAPRRVAPLPPPPRKPYRNTERR